MRNRGILARAWGEHFFKLHVLRAGFVRRFAGNFKLHRLSRGFIFRHHWGDSLGNLHRLSCWHVSAIGRRCQLRSLCCGNLKYFNRIDRFHFVRDLRRGEFSKHCRRIKLR